VIKNLGQDFHSFGNYTKINLYVDKIEVSIPLIKYCRNKNILLGKKWRGHGLPSPWPMYNKNKEFERFIK